MTVMRSYSPNGLIRPDPDYELCCGLFHATTSAKFFSIVIFGLCLTVSALNFALFGFEKLWISTFCLFYTLYCSVLVYGVFLEKASYLIPFLIVHGALTIFLTLFIILVCVFGSATNGIISHHSENMHLRDLYQMNHLDPDDDTTQAIVSGIAMIVTVSTCLISMYAWYAIKQTYQCYKHADRTMLPGYQVGIVAENDEKDKIQI